MKLSLISLVEQKLVGRKITVWREQAYNAYKYGPRYFESYYLNEPHKSGTNWIEKTTAVIKAVEFTNGNVRYGLMEITVITPLHGLKKLSDIAICIDDFDFNLK